MLVLINGEMIPKSMKEAKALVGLLIVVNKIHLFSEIKKYLVRLIFSYMFSEIAVVATLT